MCRPDRRTAYAEQWVVFRFCFCAFLPVERLTKFEFVISGQQASLVLPERRTPIGSAGWRFAGRAVSPVFSGLDQTMPLMGRLRRQRHNHRRLPRPGVQASQWPRGPCALLVEVVGSLRSMAWPEQTNPTNSVDSAFARRAAHLVISESRQTMPPMGRRKQQRRNRRKLPELQA